MNQRDEKIFDYIKSCINKPSPTNREMSDELQLAMSIVDRGLARLKAEQRIITEGTGSYRIIHIPGVGSTAPRPRADPVTYVSKSREPDGNQPRVYNYTCARCGCRNCQRHGQVSIIAGRAGGWLGAIA